MKVRNYRKETFCPNYSDVQFFVDMSTRIRVENRAASEDANVIMLILPDREIR